MTSPGVGMLAVLKVSNPGSLASLAFCYISKMQKLWNNLAVFLTSDTILAIFLTSDTILAIFLTSDTMAYPV